MDLNFNDSNWRNFCASACHYLWTWRNKHVHDSDFIRPLFPHNVIVKFVEQNRNGTSFLQPVIASSVRLVHVSWKPPKHGWFAVNDGTRLK